MDRIAGYEGPEPSQPSTQTQQNSTYSTSYRRTGSSSTAYGDPHLSLRQKTAVGNMDRVRGYEANDATVPTSRFSAIAFGGVDLGGPGDSGSSALSREEEALPTWAEEVVPIKHPKKWTQLCHYVLAALLLLGGVVLFGNAVGSLRGVLPKLDASNVDVFAIASAIANPKALVFQAAMGGIGIALVWLSMVSCIASDSDAPGSNLCRLLFLCVEVILMIALFALATSAPVHALENSTSAVGDYFKDLPENKMCEVMFRMKCRGWEAADCNDAGSCPDCADFKTDTSNLDWPSCKSRFESSVKVGTTRSLVVGVLMGLLLLLDTICVVLVFPCLHIEDSRRVVLKRKTEYAARPFEVSPW